MSSATFIKALEEGDLKTLRKIPKSDLHNHGILGGKASVIEKFYGRKLPRLKASQAGIESLNHWIVDIFIPYVKLPGAYEKAYEAAFLQAKFDGVKVLEMSMDGYLGSLWGISPQKAVDTLKYCHSTFAPEIDFHPEIGFPKHLSLRKILGFLDPFLEHGYFRSIDLYDDEKIQPIENFRELYRFARKNGLKCKAHAGEFSGAEEVRKTVEVLELDEVQHGIGAAGSAEVMKWLAERGTVLNICPTSNIFLKCVKSYKTHPVRILFDHGIKVTINTDDALLFRDGVSEQFLKLYRCGLFSAAELDTIRLNGISGLS